MKRKFCLASLVLALCFVLSGSAWAAHSADTIDISVLTVGDSGTTWSYDGSNDGSKITVTADTKVTGTVSPMTTTPAFDFNINAGATVRWEANVIGGGGNGNVVMVRGAGMFEVAQGQIKADVTTNLQVSIAIYVDGGQLKVSGGNISASGTVTDGITAICAVNNSTVTISGGNISASGNTTNPFSPGDETYNSYIRAILAHDNSAAIISGGNISVSGTAEEITAINISSNSTGTISGGTISASGTGAEEIKVIDIGDNCTGTISGGTFSVSGNATNYLSTLNIDGTGKVTVTDGAALTNESGCDIHIYGTLTNLGTINIHGTLVNYGNIINNGTINNYSSNTLINWSKINNTNGTINNQGIFQSVQTASEMGGTITGNPVQILSSSSGGSGGGCNAGFGLFGLLPLAVWATRKRMTA